MSFLKLLVCKLEPDFYKTQEFPLRPGQGVVFFSDSALLDVLRPEVL